MLDLEEYFCLHRQFLIQNLISRNLKVRYRKALLGMVWTVLIPAATAGIYFLVFNYVLKVKVEHYLLLIMGGIVPWTFFSASIASGQEVVVGNYGLLNKVPLPPQALVLAEVITHFFNLLFSVPVLLIAFFASSVPCSWALLQYPLLVALLFFTTYAISLILGLAFVYFRDLRYIVILVTQFWFYLTPVMYSIKMVPPEYAFLMKLNPIGAYFVGFQAALIDGQMMAPDLWAAALGWCLILNFAAFGLLQKLRAGIVELL